MAQKIGIAVILTLALAPVNVATAGQYGFTHEPRNYNDEYRENQWKCSEAHRYMPGYGHCSGDEWRRHRDGDR